MNQRLQTAPSEAERRLDGAAQERLAELVESAVASLAEPAWDAEELAALRALDAEPFEPADPDEARAVFLPRHKGHPAA